MTQNLLIKKYFLSGAVRVALQSIVLCAPVLILLSCRSIPLSSAESVLQAEQSAYIPDSFEWEQTDFGTRYAFFENKTLPLRYHLVELDLQHTPFCLKAYPAGQNTSPFAKISLRRFAKENNCIVAINTTPFLHGIYNAHLAGVHKINGKEYAHGIQRYGALAFKADVRQDGASFLKASIFEAQDNAELSFYDWVFGGFFAILVDSEYVHFKTESANSRTAVGISQNGTFLYILCVEGEEKTKSAGLSYRQCAEIFATLGCTDALQFDGGGSTNLFIQKKGSVFSYKPIRHIPACLGFALN